MSFGDRGAAALVVLTVCAAAIITADPDEAEAATYTVESGKTVTVSTGFSSDDISSIVDGYADWSVHGSIVGQFSSKTISPDYLSITLQIEDTTAPGTYSCRITLDILHTSDEVLTAEHSIRVTAPAPPSIRITSAGGTTAIVGTEYLYEVQTVPSDARITVSGADWLSADGHRVSGTPTSAGTFTVTVTASKAGYTPAAETVVIRVSPHLAPTNSPANGIVAMPS